MQVRPAQGHAQNCQAVKPLTVPSPQGFLGECPGLRLWHQADRREVERAPVTLNGDAALMYKRRWGQGWELD